MDKEVRVKLLMKIRGLDKKRRLLIQCNKGRLGWDGLRDERAIDLQRKRNVLVEQMHRVYDNEGEDK
jgi:hypothetical protein